MIGIIFAMEEEIASFFKDKDIINKKNIYELTFYNIKYANLDLILVESGVGKVNSARTTQIMIDNFDINLIINVGVAGGLKNNVNILDIVVANKLIQHDFDISIFNHKKGYIPKIGDYIETDNKLKNIITNLGKNLKLNILEGTIISGDKFITDIKERINLGNEYNALCCEMEGASIGQVCILCNIPFIIIRSISDSIKNNTVLKYDEFLFNSCEQITSFLNYILKELSNKL